MLDSEEAEGETSWARGPTKSKVEEAPGGAEVAV